MVIHNKYTRIHESPDLFVERSDFDFVYMLVIILRNWKFVYPVLSAVLILVLVVCF